MPKRAKDNSPTPKPEPAADPVSSLPADQERRGYYYDDTHGYEPFEDGDEDVPEPPENSGDDTECN
jgi:hypothetical protein